MTITPALFEAFLKCPSKCWLRATGETPSGNPYAEWVQSQNESYRATQTERLLAECPPDATATSPPPERLKASQWLLAVDVMAQTPEWSRSSRREEAPSSSPQPSTTNSPPTDQNLVTPPATAQPTAPQPACIAESRLHAVERVPAEGRGKAAQFTPIRFLYRNKLTTEDKLLLAFDTFVLAQALGREIPIGKLIHGDDHATLKVKTGAATGEVRKRLQKAATLLSSPTPPDLVLNRHCGECEFQARCRKIAVEKDDLSLLARMNPKERKKFRAKGIFAITQLSYTFRPRRRSKKLRDKREKYHHALKALAIREKKIHIIGSPQFKIYGTPVYLDVEGLPDRDFYYLIGLRIGNGDSAVQHSLWADTVADEGKIWREFLTILETVEKPALVHYGSYETMFFIHMNERYGGPPDGSAASKAIKEALNLLSVIFAQLYFPTYSNGLKEIGNYLGFSRCETHLDGLLSVMLRYQWVVSQSSSTKQQLKTYNAEDCAALDFLSRRIAEISRNHGKDTLDAVQAELLIRSSAFHFGKIKFVIPELNAINATAYWDYHRNRIRARCNQRSTSAAISQQRKHPRAFRFKKKALRINRVVGPPAVVICPQCGAKRVRPITASYKIVRDLKFGQAGMKRWVLKYVQRRYSCKQCGARFKCRPEGWPPHKEGSGLIAYVIYQLIEQRVSQIAVSNSLSDLFGINIPSSTLNDLKAKAAAFYRETVNALLQNLLTGRLLHVDETPIASRSGGAFIWVFCSPERVVFRRTETREATSLTELLSKFSGVLVSDFYVAYDGLQCPQQKCLIHLMRDLNNDLLNEPFNTELKLLAQEFASLLQPIVQTIDDHGSKARYLRKHKLPVVRFYKKLKKHRYKSEMAVKYVNRFERNRDKLFTFLDYDGVPWHNNYAEHGIKAFALLRRQIGGGSTSDGLDDYLILLSVFETCKYMGVDFLDFLRSGEKDIHAFAESRRGRKRRPPTSEPKALPAASPAEP
jgi:predicted RecB family nuclease